MSCSQALALGVMSVSLAVSLDKAWLAKGMTSC